MADKESGAENELMIEISSPPKTHPKRDPDTIKTINDLYHACYKDFGMQPAEVLLELGVRSQTELIEPPQELHAQIVRIISRLPTEEG